jgi:excisionase family DNA binding protein
MAEMITESDPSAVQASQGIAENTKNFVTRLLPNSGDGAAGGSAAHLEREAAPPATVWDNPGTVHPNRTTPAVMDLAALRGGRDRLLQPGEVAVQLGVCAATVYRLCERGELPHVRIVNSIRVRPRDLAAFVAGLGSH